MNRGELKHIWLGLLPISLVLVMMAIVACSPKTSYKYLPHPDSKESAAPDTKNFGDIDSSGGQASESKEEQILAILKELKYNLKLSVHRVLVYKNNQFFKAYIQGDEAFDRLTLKAQSEGKSLTDHIDTLKIIAQKEPCEAMDEVDKGKVHHREACANTKGEVRFSLDLLKRIPRDALHLEILALGIHEVAHTLGFGEGPAQEVQGWYRANPEKVLPQQDKYRRLLIEAITLRGRIPPYDLNSLRSLFRGEEGQTQFVNEICHHNGKLSAYLKIFSDRVGTYSSNRYYKFPEFIVEDVKKLNEFADDLDGGCSDIRVGSTLGDQFEQLNKYIDKLIKISMTVHSLNNKMVKFISPSNISGFYGNHWQVNSFYNFYDLRDLYDLREVKKFTNELRRTTSDLTNKRAEDFAFYYDGEFLSPLTNDGKSEAELTKGKSKIEIGMLPLEEIRCDIFTVDKQQQVHHKRLPLIKKKDALIEDKYSPHTVQFDSLLRGVVELPAEGVMRTLVVDFIGYNNAAYFGRLIRVRAPNKNKLSKIGVKYYTEVYSLDQPNVASSFVDYKSWDYLIPFDYLQGEFKFGVWSFYLAHEKAQDPYDRIDQIFNLYCGYESQLRKDHNTFIENHFDLFIKDFDPH